MEQMMCINKLKSYPFPQAIHQAILTLQKAGFEAYIVGGSIRDILLGRSPHDFDLTTDATPDQVQQLFSRTIPTGLQHGTVTAIINKEQIEITTYRIDGDYQDHRRPESVTFTASLKEDLKRRDFTINGFAWNPVTEIFIDYFDGVSDLNHHLIRAIGDPLARFNEDGLRIMRGIRFAAQLQFKIEEVTLKAIYSSIDLLKNISMERKRDELIKILTASQPSVGIELLRTSGMLQQFLPELARCYGVIQNRYHLYDVYYHTLSAIDHSKNDPTVRLALLCHDLGKPDVAQKKGDGSYQFIQHGERSAEITQQLLKRLKCSGKLIKDVTHLVRHHTIYYDSSWKDQAVRRFIKRVGERYLDLLEAIHAADSAAKDPNHHSNQFQELFQRARGLLANPKNNPFHLKMLAITGGDLIQYFHLKPSPVIGKTLNIILEQVIDDPTLNKRETLIQLAEKILKDLEV